jgi:hypothetical protein
MGPNKTTGRITPTLRCHDQNFQRKGDSGVQEFRSSGVQEFRSSGVQEFRSSGVQEFRSLNSLQKTNSKSQDRLLRISESES